MKKYIVLFVLLYFLPVGAVTYILDQSYTLYSTSGYSQIRYSATVCWQRVAPFVPSVTANIGKITLRVCKIDYPTGNVWVKICSDANCTVVVATSDNVDVSTLSTNTTDGAEKDFIFTNTASLSNGITYYIKFDGDYTISSTNHAAGFYKVVASGGTWGYFDGTTLNTSTNLLGYYKEYYIQSSAKKYMPWFLRGPDFRNGANR